MHRSLFISGSPWCVPLGALDASPGLGLDLCQCGRYSSASREGASPLVCAVGASPVSPAICGLSVVSHISVTEAERDQDLHIGGRFLT